MEEREARSGESGEEGERNVMRKRRSEDRDKSVLSLISD